MRFPGWRKVYVVNRGGWGPRSSEDAPENTPLNQPVANSLPEESPLK